MTRRRTYDNETTDKEGNYASLKRKNIPKQQIGKGNPGKLYASLKKNSMPEYGAILVKADA